jgi:hypothetical protein
MARKRKLADLVKQEVERPELQTTEVTESGSSSESEPLTTEVTEKQSDRVTSSPTTEGTNLQTTEVPKYLTLVRKETRLRDDQLEQLTAITRQMNRQRQGKGERITENTLIRIAVDLLLNQSSQLQGTTEAELLASLGLSVTDLQS